MSDERVAATLRLLDHYRKFRALRRADGESFPELKAVIVGVSSEGPLEPGANSREGAWARAVEYAGWDHGWARHRSHIWSRFAPADEPMIRPYDELAEAGDLGPPLFGEWANGSKSVHLRPHPLKAGQLCFWTYMERPLGREESLGEGEFPALRQRMDVIAVPEIGSAGSQRGETIRRVASYHVYWGGTEGDPHAVRRLLARFVGFEMKNVALSNPPGGREE